MTLMLKMKDYDSTRPMFKTVPVSLCTPPKPVSTIEGLYFRVQNFNKSDGDYSKGKRGGRDQ